MLQGMKLITVTELANLLRVSRQTVYREVRKRAIPYYKIPSSAVLFNQYEIERWVKEHHIKGRG